jgi:transposase
MADLAYREVYTMTRIQARLRLVNTYHKTSSISETARRWRTSRQVVRKWIRRYDAEGLSGLEDRSRRPQTSPSQTPPHIEEQVLEAWKKTRYGRHRLALYLRAHGLCLSPHTIRHIFRRRRPPQKRKPRKPLYPAMWAWEQDQPFSLLQTDVKDIHDKQALGTDKTSHLRRQRLPRYQWTACDARTRLRFLAYSHRLNRTNGIAFMVVVLMWLRAHDVQANTTFQTDWGQEFGGDNPTRIAQLSSRYLRPLDGDLRRYPLGRKGYNGRVERSHRTDDEEFYRPYLLHAKDSNHLLRLALHWVYFYNAIRPHFGIGMNAKPPLDVLYTLGYNGPATLGALPPIILDDISTDLVLACHKDPGNDLLARYTGDCGKRGWGEGVRCRTLKFSSGP